MHKKCFWIASNDYPTVTPEMTHIQLTLNKNRRSWTLPWKGWGLKILSGNTMPIQWLLWWIVLQAKKGP